MPRSPVFPSLLAPVLALAAALPACGRAGRSPAPPDPGEPAATTEPLVTVAYTVTEKVGDRLRSRVVAMREDGEGTPRTISRDGADARFAASLADGRAVVEELGEGRALARLAVVRADGAEARLFADLPAGYVRATRALAAVDALVAELARDDGAGADVWLLAKGAATKLATSAALLAVDAERAAVVVGPRAPQRRGDVRIVPLAGGEPLAVGGGDGEDRVVRVDGDRVLLDVASGAGDVRVASLDGRVATLGRADAAERGFAFAGDRVVFTRDGAAGAALVSARVDGGDEVALAGPAPDLEPLVMAGDATVVARQGAALLSAPVAGGAPRTLDAAAGVATSAVTIVKGFAVYTSTGSLTAELRAAPLAGGPVRTLWEATLRIPSPMAATPDGRVVFRTVLFNQLEGGDLWVVDPAGGEATQVGQRIAAPSGEVSSSLLRDQDFQAVTPQGRIVFELETETNLVGSQLASGHPSAAVSRELSPNGSVRFGGLVR